MIGEIFIANLNFFVGFILGIFVGIIGLSLLLILLWLLPSIKGKLHLMRLWLKYKKEIEDKENEDKK